MNSIEQINDFLKLIGAEEDERMRECTSMKDGHILLENQSIEIEEDQAFTGLPENLEVQFYYGAIPAISIKKCRTFKTLEYIIVRTNPIFIENCHNFFEIGRGVNAEGGIEIENAPLFEKIADDLIVESFLKISKAPLLKTIPQLKNSSTSIELQSCSLLEKIPDDFMHGEMRGSLEIKDALSLYSLPQKLWLTGSFEIEDCPKIMSLPSELKIGGGLYLKKENSITTLPEDLVVKGDAALMGCRFVSLPKRVEIGRDIYIHPEIEKEILDWIKAWKEQGMLKGEIIFST